MWLILWQENQITGIPKAGLPKETYINLQNIYQRLLTEYNDGVNFYQEKYDQSVARFEEIQRAATEVEQYEKDIGITSEGNGGEDQEKGQLNVEGGWKDSAA